MNGYTTIKIDGHEVSVFRYRCGWYYIFPGDKIGTGPHDTDADARLAARQSIPGRKVRAVFELAKWERKLDEAKKNVARLKKLAGHTTIPTPPVPI